LDCEQNGYHEDQRECHDPLEEVVEVEVEGEGELI
jgi:hypothetical protein